MNRTSKDFAIEFGEYLAKAAEHFQAVTRAELAGDHDPDLQSDTWRALSSAIYEFRKRADRATGERLEPGTSPREPWSLPTCILAILLASLGLWAAIWGFVAYPLASVLPLF